MLAPALATALGLPYVGVIRGVQAGSESGTVVACKEFPGAVMARMEVQLPAVLGILGADQPPRYVPVSRIRAAMKATQFEEPAVAVTASRLAGVGPQAVSAASGTRAEMIAGSDAEVAERIAAILAEKGLLK